MEDTTQWEDCDIDDIEVGKVNDDQNEVMVEVGEVEDIKNQVMGTTHASDDEDKDDDPPQLIPKTDDESDNENTDDADSDDEDDDEKPTAKTRTGRAVRKMITENEGQWNGPGP